jgi:hypothetical protein
MSSKNHHTNPMPEMQEADLNDAAWSEVVSTRLPANLEAQARQLKAWTRQRGLRSVHDLLRAFLVYACCQYSFRDTSGCGRCSKALARFQSERGANGWTARGHGLPGD